ncbi:MAG: K(+)-transporting ATPase subunit F [Bryobacteraceae bacterium]
MTACKDREKPLFMDHIVGGVAVILLFVYLLYALLKPEKF